MTMPYAFAENVYDINIPSGSSDKNAPFHWMSEKDGDTSGKIEIVVNDSVFWKNGDTVSHTATSGTPETGPDGIFDSGNIAPGGKFVHKFTEIGEFPYYCTVHPWRTGIVIVTSGYSVLSNVGSDAGDGATTFDIEYKLNRVINTAKIDEQSKSITFEFIGRTSSEDNSLVLFLPSKLISGISSVSIDGTSVDYKQNFEDDIIVLEVDSLKPDSKAITITGSSIVPEFGSMVMIIMAISIVSVLFLTKRNFKF